MIKHCLFSLCLASLLTNQNIDDMFDVLWIACLNHCVYIKWIILIWDISRILKFLFRPNNVFSSILSLSLCFLILLICDIKTFL
jgi:hypothetical protein